MKTERIQVIVDLEISYPAEDMGAREHCIAICLDNPYRKTSGASVAHGKFEVKRLGTHLKSP